MALRQTFSRRLSKRFNSLSFTPNPELHVMGKFKPLEESDAAVPPKPDTSHISPLYIEMTNPNDVLDIFYRPSFEEVAVTCLARDANLFGDTTYRLKSKSSISLTKFLFAQLATEWLDQIEWNIYLLAELLSEIPDLTYYNSFREEKLRDTFQPQVFSHYENLNAFYHQFLTGPGNKNFTIEEITQYLLSEAETSLQFNLVIKFLSNNVHLINPLNTKDFIAVILSNLLRSVSVEKVDSFSLFLSKHLMEFQPNVLTELSARSLNDLAYVTSASSDLSISIKAMELLVQLHKKAPLDVTFDLFISRYCKLAQSQNFTTDRILSDLTSLKSVFFHRGMDENSFKFFLSTTVNNVHDLWHIIKLAQATAPGLLCELTTEIFRKLKSIQSTSGSSQIIKGVQIAQLAKTLSQGGLKRCEELNTLLKDSCVELGLPVIHV